MSAVVSRFGPLQGSLLESPLVDHRLDCLYVADIDEHRLHCVRLADGSVEQTYDFDRPLGAVNLCKKPDWLVLSLGRDVCWFNRNTREQRMIAKDLPGAGERLNDCRVFDGLLYCGGVDPAGRAAAFFTLGPKGELHTLFEGVGISNGFFRFNDWLVYIDSLHDKRVVRRFIKARAGKWREDSPIAISLPAPAKQQITPVVLDGMWLDAAGWAWVAANAGGVVLKIELSTGRVEQTIAVGTPEVTACCIDRRGKMYITTARERHVAAGVEADADAGGLFVCDIGTPGVEPQQFNFSGK